MEEQTKKNSTESAEKKLSYEDLNKICSELYQENQNLIKKIQQMDMTNMFRRLDYLIEVVKLADVIKDPEFVNNCIDEIKEAMVIPAEETKE